MVDQISTQNPANNSSKSLKGEQVLPSEILEILRNNLIFYARSLEKMRRLSILLPLYLLNLEYYFKFKLLDHWFRSHWLHDQRLKTVLFLMNHVMVIKRSRLLMDHFLPFMAKEMSIDPQISLVFLFFMCLKCPIICYQFINSQKPTILLYSLLIYQKKNQQFCCNFLS